MAHGLLVAALRAERFDTSGRFSAAEPADQQRGHILLTRSRARLAKGCHEGKADISAEQSTPEESPRVPGANELEEWTPGAEEATGEGAQAS
jgi:hypothetical protein